MVMENGSYFAPETYKGTPMGERESVYKRPVGLKIDNQSTKLKANSFLVGEMAVFYVIKHDNQVY
jgi:hypothetical protein